VCWKEREQNIRVQCACLLVRVCVFFDRVFLCVRVRKCACVCVLTRDKAKHTHTVCVLACAGVRACLHVCV